MNTMEKKTIGKFIAALRRANGMTQRELGERLFVSDKTVSRWECDECTPELSLLPSIAEIFGITTDELLRGERNRADAAEGTERQRARSDKQFRWMLEQKRRKYRSLTLISVGVILLGWIAAMVANLAFAKGLIAFCLALAFALVSEICQICFAVNARILPDAEDDTYTERIEAENSHIVKTAVGISFCNLVFVAFCLPLTPLLCGSNFGLTFSAWLLYGTLSAAIGFVLAFLLYNFFIRKALCNCGLLVLSDKRMQAIQRNNRLLKKSMAISLGIALCFGIVIFTWNCIGISRLAKKTTLETCTDFKNYVESDYELWLLNGCTHIDENGDVIITSHPENYKVYKEIINAQGEVICEYYYNPNLYHEIRFFGTAEDPMPVTIITTEDFYNARKVFQTVESTFYVLIAADFAIAAIVCCVVMGKRKIAERGAERRAEGPTRTEG